MHVSFSREVLGKKSGGSSRRNSERNSRDKENVLKELLKITRGRLPEHGMTISQRYSTFQLRITFVFNCFKFPIG